MFLYNRVAKIEYVPFVFNLNVYVLKMAIKRYN